MVENFICNKILEILNDGVQPTFTGRNNEFNTYIDLTICSPNMSDNITNWKVDIENDSLSDHNYITFDVNANGNHDFNNNSTFDFKNCNWKEFRKEISESIDNLTVDLNSAKKLMI